MRWTSLAGTLLGVAGAAVLWKGYRNTQALELNHVTAPIRRLPASFAGFRLLQISDMHLHRYSRRGDELLASIEKIDADLICLTGDYLATAQALPELQHFFKSLSSRSTVVGVMGNADYRPSISDSERESWGHYFPMLQNGALCLERQGESLWLIGVDDPHHGRDNLEAALAPVPDAVPVILLAHSPDIITRRLDQRIRLILTGHTHGGQICLPNGRALYHNTTLSRAHASGMHCLDDDVLLYISRGVGSTRLPLRYGCLPEITLFTLQPIVNGSSASAAACAAHGKS